MKSKSSLEHIMEIQTQEKTRKKTAGKIGLIIFSAVILSYAVIFFARCITLSKTNIAEELSFEQENSLYQYLKSAYTVENQVLHPLPYSYENPKLNVLAEAAILIDVNTGDILYTKNPDRVIPPASMTKLFAMYVVDEEVSAGRLSYDQIIPIPEEALACNMPPHSSLMFLGEGHVVTLEELLLGLSICSGNDAAYALAYTICGTMEAFVERMNQIAVDLGLENTHFVESSGYSELNTTTPREMAKFCRIYLTEHPYSLKKFHSVSSFTYPKKHNMAPGDVYGAQDFSQGLPRHITMGITQANTNPLLGKLAGCDGLKTGYIDESGYNLSLTAQRNGTRFLSVTMQGPGRNSTEGQQGRVKDGLTLMNYAFENFSDFKETGFIKSYFVKSYGTKETGFNIVPAYIPDGFCIPSKDLGENYSKMSVTVNHPVKIKDTVEAGEILGSIDLKYDDKVIVSIPLVADRTTSKSNFIISFTDKLCYNFD